jgi:hypothetical protein
MEAWAFDNVHPLSIGIAYELMQEGDDPLTCAICWWLAFKFEEIEPLCIDDIMSLCYVHASYKKCCLKERDVLERNNYMIPYRTSMREIFECLTRVTFAERAWLVAICLQRVGKERSASDWAHMISMSFDFTPCALREVYNKAPPYLQSHMWIAPLRIRNKRPVDSISECVFV